MQQQRMIVQNQNNSKIIAHSVIHYQLKQTTNTQMNVVQYQLAQITTSQFALPMKASKSFNLNESLEYLFQINNHHENITTLNFFCRKMNFISSSCDTSIIIWSSPLISSLKFLAKLNGHSDQINCIVVTINIQDDLIISGSFDQTIKFYSPTCSLPSSQSCIQTIHEDTSLNYGLSINEDGNKLITCGCDELILIIENLTTISGKPNNNQG